MVLRTAPASSSIGTSRASSSASEVVGAEVLAEADAQRRVRRASENRAHDLSQPRFNGRHVHLLPIRLARPGDQALERFNRLT
jgi:hypothetical protein